MAIPKPLQEYEPLDPRLVTKTSLPKPREAIALALILWFSDGCPGAVEYGCESGISKDGGLIDADIVGKVAAYASYHTIEIEEPDIKAHLKGNPLLESQMESLNSAFELVWRLGTFAFTDSKLTRTAERTGGIRYRKRIRFSSNADLIAILFESAPDDYATVLLNWLTGGYVNGNGDAENRLIRTLGVFSEHALYKTSKGETGTVFTIEGVYDALLDGNESVDVVDPNEEVQGTTRILKSAISAGLFCALTIKGDSVAISKKTNLSALRSYVERMQVSSEIYRVKAEPVERNTMENSAIATPIDEPRNYNFFGAPGTGKSHELKRLAKLRFPNTEPTRVTFYPDYTYSQFVGCFKPFTEDSKDESGRSEITYRYIPGPFLETYINAVKNPTQNYLLIVEEINRANPAAVFGDVFQLLDRRTDGCSEYSVAAPIEMRKTLRAEGIACDKLALPSNMYIWATMNSADQGVFPMDTAFKRRWDFRYMGINEGEDADIDGTPLNKIKVKCGNRVVKWNDLRTAINDFMMSDDLKINEDKLLGPFFIDPRVLGTDRFPDVFKDKVLLYLFEDAGKTKRTKMFRKDLKTYSQICKAFDEKGEWIFGSGFDDHIVFPDEGADSDSSAELQE